MGIEAFAIDEEMLQVLILLSIILIFLYTRMDQNSPLSVKDLIHVRAILASECQNLRTVYQKNAKCLINLTNFVGSS